MTNWDSLDDDLIEDFHETQIRYAEDMLKIRENFVPNPPNWLERIGFPTVIWFAATWCAFFGIVQLMSGSFGWAVFQLVLTLLNLNTLRTHRNTLRSKRERREKALVAVAEAEEELRKIQPENPRFQHIINETEEP